jgi:hypothetical protein
MPLKNLGKPTMGNLKTGTKLMSIPHASPQRPGRVGQIATNNKIVSKRGGGASNHGGGGMKRGGKKMY